MTTFNKRVFKRIGKNVKIYEPCIFSQPEKVILGDNIIISEFNHFMGHSQIGDFVHIAPFCSIAGGGDCILDNFVGLSAGVRIITGSEDISGEGLTNPTIPIEFRSRKTSFVHCKKHSFLATNVIVLPGVTIGEGAVIGAGSIVNKDLAPWGVYIGTRRIRERPSEKILELEEKLCDLTKFL